MDHLFGRKIADFTYLSKTFESNFGWENCGSIFWWKYCRSTFWQKKIADPHFWQKY